MYKLIPSEGHITVIPLKSSETKQYSGKLLSDVETAGMDVLQYGKVVEAFELYASGDIVLYARLASDKTNFGDPRQVIVELEHVKGRVEEVSND